MSSARAACSPSAIVEQLPLKAYSAPTAITRCYRPSTVVSRSSGDGRYLDIPNIIPPTRAPFIITHSLINPGARKNLWPSGTLDGAVVARAVRFLRTPHSYKALLRYIKVTRLINTGCRPAGRCAHGLPNATGPCQLVRGSQHPRRTASGTARSLPAISQPCSSTFTLPPDGPPHRFSMATPRHVAAVLKRLCVAASCVND